ncbi:MAG: FtsX-like permease family protein [Spirochaetaceae bacterium]|nr:MAG: FtsX-like permease family protein [Spirochaetaceae bacterium]
MIRLIKLSWRNFTRNIQRYRVLLVALTLAAAALVVVLGAVLGVGHTLRAKASRYFAGDVAVLGFEQNGRSLIEQPDAIDAMIAGLEPEPVASARRSMYYELDAALFYAGYTVRQRRIVGVEWDRERPVLEGFDFVAGGVPDADDTRGVLISTSASETLGARVGDEITVVATTVRGHSNTVDLVIRGIFAEASFFGYTTYLDRVTLNRLQDLPDDTVHEMGVYVRTTADVARVSAALHASLAARYDVFPILSTRDERDLIRREQWSGRRYGVMTLDAQLSEINDLLNAISGIATVIIVFFLGIVVVGVGNTFSMIVFERTVEIGTLRALGMQRARATLLLLSEALILGAVGLGLGLLVGVGVLEFLRNTLDFTGYGWATLFLVRGRLEWRLTTAWIGAIVLVVLASAAAGCLRAALRAGRLEVVDALRHE